MPSKYVNTLNLPLELRPLGKNKMAVYDAQANRLWWVQAEMAASVAQVIYEVNRRQTLRETCQKMRQRRRDAGLCIICGQLALLNEETDEPLRYCARHLETTRANNRRQILKGTQ